MKHLVLPALALCLLPLSVRADAVGNEVFVDAVNGNDTGSAQQHRGYSGYPCKSIAYAVSIAQSGDTIVVRPGRYPIDTTVQPPLYINKRLHFHGDGDAVLVDSTAPTTGTPVSNEGHVLIGFTAGAEGSVVEGLVFDGLYVSATPQDYQGLIELLCNNVSVHHCVFRSGRNAGVRIQNAKDCTVADCDLYNLHVPIRIEDASDRVQILRNKIHFNNDLPGINDTYSVGVGVGLVVPNSPTLVQATISDNQIYNIAYAGIEVFGVHSRVLVSNNIITDTNSAISFDHPTDSLIDANTIYNSRIFGIEMAGGCKRDTASNNLIYASTGSAYSVTSNTGEPSQGINIIGGQAYGGDFNLVHVFAQSDVHIQGGLYAEGPTNGSATFRFQGSGGNSVVGTTVYSANKNSVLSIQADASYPGTDFRDNLMIGVPNAYVLDLSGSGQIGESVIGGNHVVGTIPAGFNGFIAGSLSANLVVKDNVPSDRTNATGFPDALSVFTLTNTATNATTLPLILENRGGINGPGQGVGMSFRPYSNGWELARITAVIQQSSYAPTDLLFYTNCGQAGMQEVARFSSDSNVYFLGTANSAAVHLDPVTSVATPASGVLIYYSASDHKLHARDASGDHTLW